MVQGNGRVWPKWPRRIGSRQRVWGSINFPQKTDDVNFSGEKTAFIVLTNTNKSSYSYNCPESCLCGKAFSHASHIKTARNSERTVSAMAVLWVAGAAHAEDFRGKTRYRWLIIRGITAKQQKMRSMLSGGKRESLRGRRRHRSAARRSAGAAECRNLFAAAG
jgi:hypothetical protein